MRRFRFIIVFSFFVAMMLVAFAPRSPRPPFAVAPSLFWVARQISTFYWVALLSGGIFAAWKRRDLLAPLLLTLATTQVAIEGLKWTVAEMRPDGRSFDSFPSGHTTASFAYATVMATFSPLGWLWFPFAVAVGASRVIVNAHWWQDVLGGAALGYLIAEGILTSFFCPKGVKGKRGGQGVDASP